HDADRAAGGFDLALGGCAEGVGGHGELRREVAVAEDLDAVPLVREPERDERLRGDGVALVQAAFLEEPAQPAEVDRGVLDAVAVLEAELRDAALERHLAALEPGRDAGPG